MATALAMKRMTRERPALEKANDDFFVHFKDDNILKFDAYVLGPSETLYAHKFVKLRFEIPADYPLKPPKCTFIQYSGGRIHPNLYVEGKVCLSILGTWAGEPWALAMTCETVLITIRSLLDNSPYKHEPHQRNNPSYNDYVQHNTWRWLLLDYLRHETEPSLKSRLEAYVRDHADEMLGELQIQEKAFTTRNVTSFQSPYEGHKQAVPKFETLIRDLAKAIDECRITNEDKGLATAAESAGKEEPEKSKGGKESKGTEGKGKLSAQTDGAYEYDRQSGGMSLPPFSAYSTNSPSGYSPFAHAAPFPVSCSNPGSAFNYNTAYTGSFHQYPMSQGFPNPYMMPPAQMPPASQYPPFPLPQFNQPQIPYHHSHHSHNNTTPSQPSTKTSKQKEKVVVDLT